jgi:hypothetical protein
MTFFSPFAYAFFLKESLVLETIGKIVILFTIGGLVLTIILRAVLI